MTSPVGQMFGRIAGVYDLLNHVLSMGIDKIWRRELAALAPENSASILDLAAGTLDVSIALAKARPQARILAIDFCPPMLIKGLGKLNTAALQQKILPLAGDAFRLPLPDQSMDAITMAFGIRNITPRSTALREMARVLKPGGRVCILEFGSASERIWGGLYNFYLARILPQIGRALASDKAAYEYLAATIKNFPSARELAAEMDSTGFANTQFRKLTGGIVCLHWAEKASEAVFTCAFRPLAASHFANYSGRV